MSDVAEDQGIVVGRDWDRVWALGVSYDQLDLAQVVVLCAEREASQPFAYIATPNAAFLVHVYRGNPAMMKGLAHAWLIINDSRVVKGFARLLFGKKLPLALGSDLTRALFEQVILPDDTICIVGGGAALADTLRKRFGLLHLTQVIPSYGFIRDPAEIGRCAKFVRDHPASFVFFACGAPQAELLAAEIVREGNSHGLGLCVGASLEFITGQKKRAPVVWQRTGLEWLYRLIQEPRRLGRRMLMMQLPFLMVALRYRLGGGPGPQAGRVVAWPRAKGATPL